MAESDNLNNQNSQQNSHRKDPSSADGDVERQWQGVIRRRSFLKGIGIAGATLTAGSLLGTESVAQTTRTTGRLPKGDVALLQFALWAETVESDLWTQYAELGGVGPSGGGTAQAVEEFQGFIGGNPAYKLALQNLDGDMPQYITDNTDDELSHAAFLEAFLRARGEVPVDLGSFRNLLGHIVPLKCERQFVTGHARLSDHQDGGSNSKAISNTKSLLQQPLTRQVLPELSPGECRRSAPRDIRTRPSVPHRVRSGLPDGHRPGSSP